MSNLLSSSESIQKPMTQNQPIRISNLASQNPNNRDYNMSKDDYQEEPNGSIMHCVASRN